MRVIDYLFTKLDFTILFKEPIVNSILLKGKFQTPQINFLLSKPKASSTISIYFRTVNK